MRIKGICRDCQYRWQLGVKEEKKHLFCNRFGTEHIVKNHNMKSCPHYQKASEEHIKILKKLQKSY